MKKFIILASAGLLLFGLQGARAQREVEPPAVPPMLEGKKPLAQPETREPAAPKSTEEGKVKPKAKTKANKKTQKKAAAKKESGKKPPKVAKKKSQKNQKKKPPEAVPKQQVGPGEG
jgi:outer membrane biosynthesis protein TonB